MRNAANHHLLIYDRIRKNGILALRASMPFLCCNSYDAIVPGSSVMPFGVIFTQ